MIENYDMNEEFYLHSNKLRLKRKNGVFHTLKAV